MNILLKNNIDETILFSQHISFEKRQFVDICTGLSKTVLAEKYSSAKYGSMKDIKFFAGLIVDLFDRLIGTPGTAFRRMLEEAAENEDYIVLMTPGFRNVKASANLIFELALPQINMRLINRSFPPIAELKLPRLASPCENYASLSEKEREITGFLTDHILPGPAFFEDRCIHVIFGDDIHITGSSSNKYRRECLESGARSFFSVYAVMMDPEIAFSKPSIEEALNSSRVTGKLDGSAFEILSQIDFNPVLRSLRLLLKKENYENLAAFLPLIPLQNVLKVYLSYMNNESLENENYRCSMSLLKQFLINKKALTAGGYPTTFEAQNDRLGFGH